MYFLNIYGGDYAARNSSINSETGRRDAVTLTYLLPCSILNKAFFFEKEEQELKKREKENNRITLLKTLSMN